MKKKTIRGLTKALAQSIVCLGLSAIPAMATTFMGCEAATGGMAAGALPAYERLSHGRAFGEADHLLAKSVLGVRLARSLAPVSPTASATPCDPDAFRQSIASTAVFATRPKHPAIDSDLSTASIHADRQVTVAAADGPFGSIALPFSRLKALKRMQPIYRAMKTGDFLACEKQGCPDASASLKMVIHSVADADFIKKLDAVNNAVNHILAYRSDVDSYGRDDYWATPQEILGRRVGDCEDFAILKMAALERLGVPMKSMSLVVLRDQERGLFHAVLAVRTSRGFFILDNLRPGVASDRAYPQYLALYAISAGRGYIYGRPVRERSAVASVADLGNAAPGEGPGKDRSQMAADAESFLAAALSADAVPID